jgi:hypothetical protein
MLDVSARIKLGNKLLEAFKKHEAIFSTHTSASKNDIGMDKETYLNYITFISSIDYQKGIDADDLWKAGKEWVKKYPWLFKPKELLSKNTPEVVKAFKEIRENYGGVFRIQDIGIWLLIAATLSKYYEGETSVLLEKFDYNASRIKEKLNNELKKEFPFLSGEKILPMWLKILKEDGGIDLKNMNEIPLPVDKNVARATFNLIFHEKFDGKVSEDIRERARKAWKDVADKIGEIGVPVIDFDTPLWILGGNEGCATAKKSCRNASKCPVKEFCRFFQ